MMIVKNIAGEDASKTHRADTEQIEKNLRIPEAR